ncbi:DUF4097 family beta strand repeat-containing protein [Marinitoga sp. 38H-ov]|uniref:DUF4097 family beta strand repeat-containing protein n=1 Tax=Marinitoga sp. 38H-ov TaxID=1755814 RepID=UPI0013ECB28A|nr:DUF4097 family beta strand repeat-containing protein [Marinitoga sp. 38H-ov]KAF2957049.1 hypothetical protein AS160_03445 [Marinitoga sp. 38H-ov]
MILKPDNTFSNVEINCVNVDITINSSTNNSFEIEDLTKNIEIENFVKNDVWYINIKPKNESFLSKIFGFQFTQSNDLDANLYINQDVLNIRINTVSSDISANNILLDKFNIKNVSGDVDINNSKINSLIINGTSGDLETHNSSIKSFYIKTVSGDCVIDYLHENFKLVKIKSVSGDAHLYINGEKEIYLKKESSLSGDINTNIPVKFEESDERYIIFNTLSGDLFIERTNIKTNQNNEKTINQNSSVQKNNNLLNDNLLTIEEQKILELYISGKINKEFAIELLENIGYTKEDAYIFLKEHLGGE